MAKKVLVYPRVSTSWPSGVYLGSWNGDSSQRSAQVAALAGFEAWRGRPVSHIVDFIASANSATWTQIEGTNWSPQIAALPLSTRQKFIVTVPMLPADTTTNLALGSSGTYDSHWSALATTLVRLGMGSVPVRFGHEFNGNWYRWSTGTNISSGNSNLGEADFIGYWRKIHTAMRAAGYTGKIIWCPNAGVSPTTSYLAENAYPGDAYVDIVAPDCYDQSYDSRSYPYSVNDTSLQKTDRQLIAWKDGGIGQRGISYWMDFSISHSKQFGLTEWGTMDRVDGHGGIDNSDFVRRVHVLLGQFYAAHTSSLAFECYFNSVGTSVTSYLGPSSTTMPKAAAQYVYRWNR